MSPRAAARAPVSDSQTPPGRPTTPPPGRRSSARSRTWRAAATAAGARGCAGKRNLAADFALFAAAVNLARLAVLAVAAHQGGCQANTTCPGGLPAARRARATNTPAALHHPGGLSHDQDLTRPPARTSPQTTPFRTSLLVALAGAPTRGG